MMKVMIAGLSGMKTESGAKNKRFFFSWKEAGAGAVAPAPADLSAQVKFIDIKFHLCG